MCVVKGGDGSRSVYKGVLRNGVYRKISFYYLLLFSPRKKRHMLYI